MEIVDMEDDNHHEICDYYKNYSIVKKELQIILQPNIYMQPLQNIVLCYLQNVIYLKSTKDSFAAIACYIPYLIFQSPVMEMKVNVTDFIIELSYSTIEIQMLVDYVHSHGLRQGFIIPKPLQSHKLSDHTNCLWDIWFINRFDSYKNELLYNMTKFANEINIKSLLYLLCAKTALKIKGLPVEQIKIVLDLDLIVSKQRFDDSPPICNCGTH